MEEIMENIWKSGEVIYTKNLCPGQKVYGEKSFSRDGESFREWEPRRSKLGAAIMKGLRETEIKKDSKVLYLGAASGTTISHVSDIVETGFVYGVEYSKKVVTDLLHVAKERKNLCPILGDARKPEEYENIVSTVDILFQDVAQPDQVKIFKKNFDKFVKEGGKGILAVKSQSISSSKPKKEVFEEQEEKLLETFKIVWKDNLEPYEKDHMVYVIEKK